jgi:hypothetical protein
VGAPVSVLVDELRELLGEAEAWARVEGDGRAESAVTRLSQVVERIEEVPLEPSSIH